MIKALLLLFEPMAAWDRIVRAQRGVGFILIVYLLPLLVLPSLTEGYSLMRWGKPREHMTLPKDYTLGETVVYESAQLVLLLLTVFIGAQLIKILGETFHGRNTYKQTFALVAYGLSPLFTLRLLDAVPSVNPWIGWTIGIVLSVGVLYQGVPRMMLPDPPHAFGLYLMSVILLVILTALARFFTFWYLLGKFTPLEKFVSGLFS